MSEDIDLTEILEAQKKIMHVLAKLEMEYSDANFGEHVANIVVGFIGSWKFLIGQGMMLLFYIIINSIWLLSPTPFDPYPFILLNLMLSFQAAFTAPLLLIAQNMSERRDRRRSVDAYRTVLHIEDMLQDLQTKLERKKNGTQG